MNLAILKMRTLRNFILTELCASAVVFCAVANATENRWAAKSPDGKIVVSARSDEHLSYSVAFRGQTVVGNSALGITLDGRDLGRGAMSYGKPELNEVDEHYATRGVHAVATNHYNGVTVPLASGNTQWQIEFRVFNDGVAYRYRVPGKDTRRINGESSEWNVPAGSVLWHQDENDAEYQGKYYPDIVGQLPQNLKLMAPAALKLPDNAGYAIMSEANLVSYSDMALLASGSNTFKAFFHYDTNGWTHEGEIVSPWRVTILAADLNTLVNSDMIKNLCPPPSPDLARANWIRPGRSIWGWLSCYCAPKLEEQKAWIDDAKAMGYEYYLIDDGWRDWNGGGDNAWKAMEGIVAYARTQNIAVWAWVHAKYVFTPEDRAAYFKRARDIGIVGLKIDFPHPANAVWVQWYEDSLREAAALELMVDFHGAVKPTGRERTWPNEMTREAIGGREQGKNPSIHDTALPFLRYVQGHADYTPTLFIPKRLDGSSFAHELAMPIVYTSPFLCMGDNPKHYLESDAADVLKALPSVWDETRVLPGSEIGQLAVFARRSNGQWFVGAINNSMPRRVAVALDFLGAGAYKLVELADNPNRNDAFVRVERDAVTRKDVLTLPLRKDGGYVAWLRPEKDEASRLNY
jgi:alpha-glucosidase